MLVATDPQWPSRAGLLEHPPGRPQVDGQRARFSDQGLDWQYETTASGVKLSATVAAKRGPRSYEFGYQLIGSSGEDLGINDRGELVGSGFIVPAPTVTGANGISYSPGTWKALPGQRVAFDFDDSTLAPDAFPYVIDPTTIFASSADDGWGVTGYSPTYPPATGSSYGHPFSAGNDFLPSGGNNGRVSCASACYATTTGVIRWNTASLPDDATVLSAAVGGNIGRVDKADNPELIYTWSRWWPVGTEDLLSDPRRPGETPPFLLSYLSPNAYNEIGFRNDNTNGVSTTDYTEMRYLVATKARLPARMASATPPPRRSRLPIAWPPPPTTSTASRCWPTGPSLTGR